MFLHHDAIRINPFTRTQCFEFPLNIPQFHFYILGLNHSTIMSRENSNIFFAFTTKQKNHINVIIIVTSLRNDGENSHRKNINTIFGRNLLCYHPIYHLCSDWVRFNVFVLKFTQSVNRFNCNSTLIFIFSPFLFQPYCFSLSISISTSLYFEYTLCNENIYVINCKYIMNY